KEEEEDDDDHVLVYVIIIMYYTTFFLLLIIPKHTIKPNPTTPKHALFPFQQPLRRLIPLRLHIPQPQLLLLLLGALILLDRHLRILIGSIQILHITRPQRILHHKRKRHLPLLRLGEPLEELLPPLA